MTPNAPGMTPKQPKRTTELAPKASERRPMTPQSPAMTASISTTEDTELHGRRFFSAPFWLKLREGKFLADGADLILLVADFIGFDRLAFSINF